MNIPTSLPKYAQRTTAALANSQRLLAASCVLIVPACLRGCLLAWLLAWAWWLAPGRTTGELYPRYLKLIDGRVLLTFTVRCGRNVDGSGTPDHLHHCVNTTDGENVGLRAAFSYDDVSSVLSHSPTVSVDATSAVRQARTGLYRCAALALGQVIVRTQYRLQ